VGVGLIVGVSEVGLVVGASEVGLVVGASEVGVVVGASEVGRYDDVHVGTEVGTGVGQPGMKLGAPN
jgi:hypothetical protein